MVFFDKFKIVDWMLKYFAGIMACRIQQGVSRKSRQLRPKRSQKPQSLRLGCCQNRNRKWNDHPIGLLRSDRMSAGLVGCCRVVSERWIDDVVNGYFLVGDAIRRRFSGSAPLLKCNVIHQFLLSSCSWFISFQVFLRANLFPLTARTLSDLSFRLS